MSDEVAYELQIEGSHLGDDDTDASLVKFPGSEKIYGFNYTKPRKLPEHIYFEANVETLRHIDFPINDQAWPIMSRRMIDTLLSVGNFAHRAIPVTMLDDTLEPHFDAAGKPLPGVALEGFYIVQLTEHLDAFDWERSEYSRDPIMDDQIASAKRIVLKDVPLPPLFRLAAIPRLLLVPAAAKHALERAGIEGVFYVPLSKVV